MILKQGLIGFFLIVLSIAVIATLEEIDILTEGQEFIEKSL